MNDGTRSISHATAFKADLHFVRFLVPNKVVPFCVNTSYNLTGNPSPNIVTYLKELPDPICLKNKWEVNFQPLLRMAFKLYLGNINHETRK